MAKRGGGTDPGGYSVHTAVALSASAIMAAIKLVRGSSLRQTRLSSR